MLNKNPDRRPGISQIIQTKLITKYTKTLISYGRAIKLQVDDLKKGFEEIAGDEAKELAAAGTTEESKGKQSDLSIKGGDMSQSSKVIAKDDKKVNTLGEMKKKKEEEKKASTNI